MRYRGKYEAVPVRRSRRKGSIYLQMLITSGISFVLCCSMLLGTTMAWFTDTITSSANQITIGELKVDVLYGGYSLRNTSTPVFGGSSDDFIWSPGAYQIKELIVENQGNLDLNYALTFLSEETDQTAFQYFNVYVKKGSDPKAVLSVIQQEAEGWKYVATLSQILNNDATTVAAERLDAGDGEKAHHVYSIALVMPSNVKDSTIQGANLSLNIQLHAYQVTAATEETSASAASETEPPAEGGQTE